jgi:serine/threonine protein kinase
MTEDNKTSLYSEEGKNKTGLYSSDEVKKHVDHQGINVGDKILLKGNEYSVLKIISEGTGEANLYQIENGAGQKYAFKLYYEFKFESEEPNGVALGRIQKLNDPDILKLIDFGIGPDKYNGKYCFEISEFAPGGNILEVSDFKKKYTPKFIEEFIVPQIYLAITKLHEFKIFHCDLKPSNILYIDEKQTDLVIGDYGSAKAYDLQSEKDLRKSTTIKGTEFYLPPEQARGIVSHKNDYYSFGMVLLHLTYPEIIASENNFREIDKDKFEQIVERQYSLKPIIEFNPSLKKLNLLIEGLTLINHINRWGADEIEKWLKGEIIKVSYQTKQATDVPPLKIGRIEIFSAEELVNYIETKNTWFQDLFEDPDVFKLLKAWLDNYIGIPDRKRFERLVKENQSYGKLILQAAVTMFLLPQRPLVIEAQSFDFYNSDNITKTVSAYLAKADSIYKVTTFDLLRVYFFRLEYTLKVLHYMNPENKNILANLFMLYGPFDANTKLSAEFDYTTKLPAQINPSKEPVSYAYLLNIFYSFNDQRAYPDNAGRPVKSIEDIALFYLSYKELYENKYHVFERSALLTKLNQVKVIGLKYDDFITKVLSGFADKRIVLEYISFDKICNVHYSIHYILDNYLKKNGINEIIKINEETGFIYAEKNMSSSGSAVKSFIEYLQKEHKSLNLPQESFEEIKTTFVQQHRKYFRLNKIVSIVSLSLIGLLIVAIIVKLSNG